MPGQQLGKGVNGGLSGNDRTLAGDLETCEQDGGNHSRARVGV